MQENESFEHRPAHRAPTADGIGGRLRTSLRGRGRYVAVATVTLVGFGLAGVSALTTGTGDPQPADLAAVSTNQQSRANVAQRADRSQRDPASAATPSAAAPPAGATTPAAPATGAAAQPPATTSAPAPAKTHAPKPNWVSPMPGAPTTSCFGPRWGTMHAGIDLAEPAGTPIHAAGAGTVYGAGWLYTGYGNSVVIDHGNGFFTHYAHQSRVVVHEGQHVNAGDIIGYEGSTGDSTGPHLHFEVHRGMWHQIDPAPWMRARGVDLGC